MQELTEFSTIIILLLIWDVIWRGLALWKAARNNQKYWYMALLIINSVGIVPIVYLKFFQKNDKMATPNDLLEKTKESL